MCSQEPLEIAVAVFYRRDALSGAKELKTSWCRVASITVALPSSLLDREIDKAKLSLCVLLKVAGDGSN